MTKATPTLTVPASSLDADRLAELGVTASAEAVAVASVASEPATPIDAGDSAEPDKPRGYVKLDFPFLRGPRTIAEVVVRKPSSGELRGTTLMALMQMDVAALTTILPRITIPALTKPEIEKLDPADFTQMGSEVLDFLLPSAAKQG